MRSKLFVGTLLVAAVVLTAGVAEAQASINSGRVKKNGVSYFNATLDSAAIVSLEAYFKEKNIDADIVIFDVTDGSGGREAEDTIGIFNSTVAAYEAGAFSAVAGVKVLICIMHESGPASRFDLFAWSKVGADIASGNVGRSRPVRISEGGAFDLYGTVGPELTGVQEALQRIAEAKHR